mgnify:CR=1 FL=1
MTEFLSDRARAFDQIVEGYSGPLFLEVSPRTVHKHCERIYRKLGVRSGST